MPRAVGVPPLPLWAVVRDCSRGQASRSRPGSPSEMYAPVHTQSVVSHSVLRNSLEGPGTGFQILEGRPEIHRGLVSLGIRSPCATSVATALEPGACKACLEELLDPDLEAFSPAASLLLRLPLTG